ncbi:MAG: hypothetical protein OEY19_12655 [Gammaproteobacteria bacterium]|nr:hypothetical protein [Gammaproteobacteria bacterium]
MTNRTNKYEVIIASDVSDRDGIGLEIYKNGDLVVEIFRDDTERTRNITCYKNTVSLEEMEEFIGIFKKEVPWEFIEYED